MRHSILTRLMALMLGLVLLIASTPINSSASGTDTDESSDYTYDASEYVSEMISHNYTCVSADYNKPEYQGDPVEISIENSIADVNQGYLTADNHDYKNEVANLVIGDEVTINVNVPESAGYFIRVDYLSYDESILPIEFSAQVNGEYLFYEMRQLELATTWVSPEEKVYDRYGKEIVSIPDKLIQWESKYFMDSSYRHSTPFIIELDQGMNQITLSVSEGSLLLGNIYLEAVTTIPEYQGSEVATGDELITIQAENFTYRNDSSIHAVAEYEVDCDPYEVTETVLNTIDSASYSKAGQTVTYEFSVDKDGYYYIAMNYRQSDKEDFPVFIDVAIDGVIQNTAFKQYPLDYITEYKTITLKDDDKNKISTYLSAGTHQISITLNYDALCETFETVNRIMSNVNDLSLEVTKVAGTNKDKYRDLSLVKYIPDVQERLLGWADELDALRESAQKYNSNVDSIACFSSASVAAKQLRSLAKDPDELTYRVAELATSINSVNHFLSTLIDELGENDLAIDRIYVYQEGAKLPEKVGFFKTVYLTVKRFLSSFFDQAYSISNVDETHIQVWVNRSRQYLELMQKMIDESFTPQTGIQVDLSLMPDQQKLVLANASGDAPDIATGINYAIPFELGIRGATTDLTQFDDFKEVASQYSPGLLVPYQIGQGIYALPETMNFWVLFYRTDVLDKLGLEVPNTLDDVINMLPELQMRGLNFYYPTAGMLTMRNFHGTTPLIYQNGGSLYSKYAGNTALNSENSILGLTQLTELFTIYNLPVDVPSFYQHFRNGDLPIGIGDYSVYNLLTNAAPEISNSWKVALVPGVEDEDGNVLRYTAGGAESTVMFSSTPEREEQAWEFMKWWSSAETQIEFGETLQITYGDEYLWCSANSEAFANLPWDSDDKETILEQASWILEAPRILGTYMLERELSNAFNDIVVNGETLRTRIDEAVKTIDRETERKLEEFGYLDDNGNVLKEYIVPTIDTVNEILYSTQ